MRIRSIKPEFYRSNDISDLSIEDRLLFIGLWSYVDDNGVGLDELHIVVAELFARDHLENPRDTVARVSRGLQNIATNGLITRYQVAGKPYIYVNSWEKHQRIDKPNKPRYPLPDQGFQETLATPSRDSREALAPGTEEQRNRGTEEQRNRKPSARDRAAAPPALVVVPTGPGFDDFWNTYPRRVDKPAARRAWTKATKTTNPEQIITAAAAYRDDPNRVDQFTKHPGPWLNAEAWNNPPLPNRNAGQKESSLDRRDRQLRETFAALELINPDQKALGQ